jgi:hypothetical protein
MGVTLADVREFALPLPRTYEGMVVPERLAAEVLGPL